MPELGVYAAPLEIGPVREPHRQTVIMLHGRGSNGSAFGHELLGWPVVGRALAAGRTLRDLLPHACFVFPTAAPRRARVYRRAVLNQVRTARTLLGRPKTLSLREVVRQWRVDGPNTNTHWMVEGLRESTAFVHLLVQQHIRKVGAHNVVLGGLSQGCATVLASVLLDSGQNNRAASDVPVAYFGLCGWLPFADMLECEAGLPVARIGEERDVDEESDPFAQGTSSGKDQADLGLPESATCKADAAAPDENDPFERDSTDKKTQTVLASVRSLLRSELDIAAPIETEVDFQRPVFLGHGVEDEKVSIKLGRQAARCLEGLDVDVRWEEYERLGHWYSDEMLYDMVKFLREKAGWEIEGWVESGE